MPQFRSKPTTIEAEQWRQVEPFAHPGVALDRQLGRARYYVVTIHEQRAYLDDGDWIIREPVQDRERFYPCKPDVFENKYEPARS